MHIGLSGLKARYLLDRRGSVAIEFAAVSIPLLAMMFGIIGVGLYFFNLTMLEYGVEQASRELRTGEMQTANQTNQDFKARVCDYAMILVDCEQNIRVSVAEFTDFQNVQVPDCLDDTGAIVSNSEGSDAVAGATDSVVLVAACYEWALGGIIPFLDLGNMSNGSTLLQTATTFRTENF